METTLNLPSTAASAPSMTPVLPRAMTSKVQEVESADGSATLPANKPFVAQVVTARLSGTEFPENPSEIAPPDRTLRPYGVPMLPYENGEAPTVEPAAVAPDPSAKVPDETAQSTI